tara:strand:+ start:20244 stop:20951 length:708 start_codon:yes stop_codon:yes gene_type:complete
MRKGKFDLTGKAVDCRKLRAMGSAGKEIFRALKVACGNKESVNSGYSRIVEDGCSYLELTRPSSLLICTMNALEPLIIQPSNVLGQARIGAAKDGATLVFEGDEFDAKNTTIYWSDGSKSTTSHRKCKLIVSVNPMIIGYKLVVEKPVIKKFAATLDEEIESRILAEKVGFKELCPVCSPKEWVDREKEAYDDLRDTHIENVRELMEKDKEIELLKQRIKDLHRAMNDARVCMDV